MHAEMFVRKYILQSNLQVINDLCERVNWDAEEESDDDYNPIETGKLIAVKSMLDGVKSISTRNENPIHLEGYKLFIS